MGSIGAFEIVCGVGRHAVARERGMRRVPVVVRRFGSEREARAYAIEDNLFNPTTASSRPSLAHMLVLARVLKECGVECTPRQVWEAAGVSPRPTDARTAASAGRWEKSFRTTLSYRDSTSRGRWLRSSGKT